jgi:hypothetical protein
MGLRENHADIGSTGSGPEVGGRYRNINRQQERQNRIEVMESQNSLSRDENEDLNKDDDDRAYFEGGDSDRGKSNNNSRNNTTKPRPPPLR